MSTAVRGFSLGLVAGLLLAAFGAGGTRFAAYVRVSGPGQVVFDARLDESAFGRLTNVPLGTLGEATFTKDTWIILTKYRFALQIRPQAMPGPERVAQGLQVAVRLPGRVVTTNAGTFDADTLVWDPVPAGELVATTRAIHWGRMIVVLAALVLGGLIMELAPGLVGSSRRS